jgi:DNA-binding CsgD family transcriptional regulator
MRQNSAPITEEPFTRSIAAIYEAAVTPDRWTAALRHMRELFGLGSTAYLVHSADRSYIDRVTAEVDPEGHQANVNHLLRESIAYRRGSPWQSGQIKRMTELVPTRTFHRSSMYQEYWRPRGLSDGLRLTISVDSKGVCHGLNLLRSKAGGPFTDAEIEVARALMPHLRHAVALRQRLNHVDMLASAALAALDAQRHAILVLDQDAQVLHTNAAADVLLREGDGLSCTLGKLQAATPAATGWLQAALAKAAGAGGLTVRAATSRLPRRSGRRPLAALVMPFSAEAHWSLCRQPRILLCITDPDTALVPSGRQMAELFGLTGAEAALAVDLLAGEDVREIAERRGRSIATVRSQLANLMAKTDVNRQSELLRLLGSLPRLREPDQDRTG